MSAAPRTPDTGAVTAAERLHEARGLERAGDGDRALETYFDAIAEARASGLWAVQAEALRRYAILCHQRGNAAEAADACGESLAIATRHGDGALAAEALNARAAFALDRGDLDTARDLFQSALRERGASAELHARIEGNLGIIANVEGDFEGALEHYRRSLGAYQAAGDPHGCARALNNLGMITADRGELADAERYFDQSRALAETHGDLRLQGLSLLNHAEVLVIRQQYDHARTRAENALAIFDRLGAQLDKPDAYRVIGTVYRETGRLALAEARLTRAIDLAARTESPLSEAEASREMALLYQAMGRNQDALRLLNSAHGLFGRLNARGDLIDVSRKVAQLEDTFLRVVREWGQSIESADSYTYGHCERVAGYAERVARALGMTENQITTIRLGAYLHDVGKIKVPHEVLNKPARLTAEEFDIIKMHPIWGVELLDAVEFPWDIKPIIRWHHEKYDGTGYPDRLRGDEIPLSAMVIGIVDVYDALTTTRSYRGAMEPAVALAEMHRMRAAWRDDVFDAFRRAMADHLTAEESQPLPSAA